MSICICLQDKKDLTCFSHKAPNLSEVMLHFIKVNFCVSSICIMIHMQNPFIYQQKEWVFPIPFVDEIPQLLSLQVRSAFQNDI